MKKRLRPGVREVNPTLPEMHTADALMVKAMEMALTNKRRRSYVEYVGNAVYWVLMLCIAAWFFAMTIDRDVPVRIVGREIVNPGRRVVQGEQILVRSTRTRTRPCPMIRKWSLVDGRGRRHEFDPEPFDAYGPVTPDDKPETDITGPFVPIDAAPGQGSLITVLSWDCNVLQRALRWSIPLVQPRLQFEIVARPHE